MTTNNTTNITNATNVTSNSNLTSLTGVLYPNIPHENQSAVDHAAMFSPPRVIKVTDGVYSAIGFSMGNVLMIEGTDGIIIIDTLETNEAAQKALDALHKITTKPVVAVIYTHNHVDHTEGAGVFVKDGEKAGKKVDVIAQASLLTNYYKSYGTLAQQQARYSYRWGGSFLPTEGEDRVISAGIGLPTQLGTSSFVPPNVTFNKTLNVTYAGVKMILGSQPGETPDELYVWLPEKKILFVGENLYKLFPNLYSMRGIRYI